MSPMLNDPDKQAENTPLEVRCYFVRHRNALVTRAQFGQLYMDYYLHLMQHQIRYEPAHDQLLKEGLAALTLHLASRPINEAAAWTINLQDPHLNLFLTGSNRMGNVTGRVFTDNVKRADANLFHSQVTREGEPIRNSSIDFTEADVFHAVETYYQMSEQRPARLFEFGPEDYVMVTAQPDCDMPWFLTLGDETIRDLDEAEELSLIELRRYCFDCGCTAERMYPALASVAADALDEIFADGAAARAHCPRCGAVFTLTREGLVAFLAARETEDS